MKKIFLPLLALVAGFILAFIAAGVSSLFFVLLPILAFVFGYFSSKAWGLLCGFLLFASYTFAMSIIWWGLDSPNLLYPTPYIGAFVAGGFTLLLIGTSASIVRTRRKPDSITALVILALVVGWCGYTAWPHYGYYYQVALRSSEHLNNVELYVPVATVAGKPYEALYRQVWAMPEGTTENFTKDIVDTEQGKMLKITFPALSKDNVPEPRYTANIIFAVAEGMNSWVTSAPPQLIRLSPKSDVVQVNTLTGQEYIGPVKRQESKTIERFQVPVKITASSTAKITLTMWNRTDRNEALNFTYTYGKSSAYTEDISYDIQTNGEWTSVPVEATSMMEIRGIGD